MFIRLNQDFVITESGITDFVIIIYNVCIFLLFNKNKKLDREDFQLLHSKFINLNE